MQAENPGESAPSPRKERFHDDAHGGGHGGTEMGWLVSYADMMTLLFGLFVILFSLATDKSKNVEKVMKAVSQKYFNQTGGNLVPQKDEAEVPNPETLKQEIEKLKGSLASAQEESERKGQEAHEFQAAATALEQEKESLQKKLASQDKNASRSSALKAATELRKEVESLKSQIAETKAENQKLHDELTKGKSPAQNYMMVLVTWETEKHDLDLQVLTPSQKNFNFKRRKFNGEPGQFELDSRFGPGIEMWKAVNFNPGKYHAKVSLYSKNGNENPARLQLTVITNLSTYNSPKLELAKKGDQADIEFNIDNEGAVQFTGAPP